MKKTNLLLQQCLVESSATRVKINNSQYKNTSGFLLSRDGTRSKIFIENSDYKIITVPSSIVKITEFSNRQLSLEQLLSAIIAVAGSNNYRPGDINNIFECKDLNKLNIILNEKGIKYNNINGSRLILNEAIIGTSLLLKLIYMLIGDAVYGIVNTQSTKGLDSVIHNVIQSFPETTEYLNGLSRYGPIAVHIGAIYIATRMARQVLIRVATGTASMERLEKDFKRILVVRKRLLNWLEKLKDPITEEEAIKYFNTPEKYFTVNVGNVNFLQKINSIGDSLYANEATKDIFYLDQNTRNLYITNRYHSKKHIQLDKAEKIISNNADSIISTSIFALAPSGIIARSLNKIRGWLNPEVPRPRKLPPPLPELGDSSQISSPSPIEDVISTIISDDNKQ
jgi:hypothetical protein